MLLKDVFWLVYFRGSCVLVEYAGGAAEKGGCWLEDYADDKLCKTMLLKAVFWLVYFKGSWWLVEYSGGAAEGWLLIGADYAGDKLCKLMMLREVFWLVEYLMASYDWGNMQVVLLKGGCWLVQITLVTNAAERRPLIGGISNGI